MDLSSLNPSQRDAVITTEGPLLILAGAGSGKTRVITHRVCYLLEQGVEARNIMALSFTNKAANEMKERVQKMVGRKAAKELSLSTFHSLGAMMLREDPDGFRVPGRFSIMDAGDSYGVVRSLLRESGVHGHGGDRRYDLGAIVQRISLWKNDFLTAQQVKERAVDEYDEAAAIVYPAYAERLQSLGAVDFDDLVCRIAEVLASDDEVRDRWQERFRYLMVDEYQDTNRAQFEMIRQIAGEKENLCVVGDDDQAIYGWRGAKVENILGFDLFFPRAKTVKLEDNYRSRPHIVEAANYVIRNNAKRYDKTLIPNRPEGEEVQIVTVADGDKETKWVGSKIRSLVFDENISPDHIAVLYRSAKQAKPIEELLQEHGISYRVLGGQAFYDKKEVRDVVAYLSVLLAPNDELSVRRALDTPSRGIGAKTVEKLNQHAKKNNCRMFDAVMAYDQVEDIGARPAAGLKAFVDLISTARKKMFASGNVAEPLRDILQTLNFRDYILKETGSSEATKQRWGDVDYLVQSVGRFNEKFPLDQRSKWTEYLNNLRLDRSKSKSEGEDEVKPATVTLATIHSAKGLEWSQVFMIGCEEGTMPHKRVSAPRASDAIEGDLQEERRLFYVGVTRARDRLWLTKALTRTERGRDAPTVTSRFVEELPEQYIHHYDVQDREQLNADQMEAMADDFLSRLMAAQKSDKADS